MFLTLTPCRAPTIKLAWQLQSAVINSIPAEHSTMKGDVVFPLNKMAKTFPVGNFKNQNFKWPPII